MSARRELVVRGLAALRRSATWWTVSVVFYVGLNAAFWPSLKGSDALKGYEDMGKLLEAFGAQNIATSAGYLDGQLFALMLPLLLSGMAVAVVSAVTSGDEDAGRLELLHALPVSRRAVWSSRWIAGSAFVLLAGALSAACLIALLRPFSFEGIGWASIAAATFGCVLLALFHAAVTFTAGGLGLSRGRAVGAGMFVLVAGYVMSFLLPLADRLAGARKGSPWFWALGEQPVTNGVDGARLGLLLAVTAVIVVAGLVAVERRDIRTP
jgi:ABC-2 type transport system permease protein